MGAANSPVTLLPRLGRNRHLPPKQIQAWVSSGPPSQSHEAACSTGAHFPPEHVKPIQERLGISTHMSVSLSCSLLLLNDPNAVRGSGRSPAARSTPALCLQLINQTPCKASASASPWALQDEPNHLQMQPGSLFHPRAFHSSGSSSSSKLPKINYQITGIINVCTIKLAARVLCGQEEGCDHYKNPLSWHHTLWRHQ